MRGKGIWGKRMREFCLSFPVRREQGKALFANEIRNIYPELNYSISMTTRTARVGGRRGGQLLFLDQRKSLKTDKRRGLFGSMHVYTAIITEHQRKVFLI